MKDNYFDDVGNYLSQIQNLDALFQRWKYKPTIVPMLDAYSPYQSLQDPQLDQSYKVLDSNADLLLLRADSTLFLARAISKHIRKEFLPLRLSYSNSVIRQSKEINDNEIRQNGIELIGVPSIAGEFEVILLLSIALETVAPAQFRIHIGSRDIVALCAECCIKEPSKETQDAFFAAVSRRDAPAIALLGLPDILNDVLLRIMEIDDFVTVMSKITQLLPKQDKLLVALQKYHLLIQALAQVIDPQYIRCDFSELGDKDYYTNIVFSCYANNLSRAVAQGGRYDSLMQHFEIDSPAVGATIFPHTLMPYFKKKGWIETQDKTSHTENPFNALINIAEPNIQDLVRCAQTKLHTHTKPNSKPNIRTESPT